MLCLQLPFRRTVYNLIPNFSFAMDRHSIGSAVFLRFIDRFSSFYRSILFVPSINFVFFSSHRLIPLGKRWKPWRIHAAPFKIIILFINWIELQAQQNSVNAFFECFTWLLPINFLNATNILRSMRHSFVHLFRELQLIQPKHYVFNLSSRSKIIKSAWCGPVCALRACV